MSGHHVIYRHDPSEGPRWSARTMTGGEDITVAADRLRDARSAVSARLGSGPVVEHVEHPLADGVYLRQALDGGCRDRDHVAGVLRRCLSDRRVLHRLRCTTVAGDLVVLACLPEDRVEWVLAQPEEATALVVATAVCNTRAWWNVLAAPSAAGAEHLPGLDRWGLRDADATIDTWMAKSPIGQTVTRGQPPVLAHAA